jgi:hypothetical protein
MCGVRKEPSSWCTMATSIPETEYAKKQTFGVAVKVTGKIVMDAAKHFMDL